MPDDSSPQFSAPNDADYQQLAEQWQAVVGLVAEDYKLVLDQSKRSIELLQRVLDDDLVGQNEYGLQCLGVALGRIMARNIEGLDWWSVEDGFGRSLCLRFMATTLRINPITMISKRIMRGERVNVRHLYDTTESQIQRIGRSMQ